VKVGQLFRDRLDADGPTWEDVRSLTPRGNATERHVGRAALVRLREIAGARGVPVSEVIERWLRGRSTGGGGRRGVAELSSRQATQGRRPMLRAGNRRCVRFLRGVARHVSGFGAIPTYPVLGNPVTSGERDVEALLDRLEASGFTQSKLYRTAIRGSGWRRLSRPPAAAGGRYSMERSTTHPKHATARPVCTRSGVRALVPPKHRADAGPPGRRKPRGTGVRRRERPTFDPGRAGAVRVFHQVSDISSITNRAQQKWLTQKFKLKSRKEN